MKKGLIILGSGESGTGAAILGKQKGFEVFVSDKGKIKEKYKSVLVHHEVEFEEGEHTLSRILGADLVVKSPGIPDNISMINKIRELGTPVISEIEFAARYTDAFKICITGSNGKTTTTLWIYHILKTAGLNVGLAGNVGDSFAWQVAENDFDYYVLEISSFQLDGMFNFKADIAILMNITPDHLDRYYNDFSLYANSKFRILQNLTESDSFIYCADDPVINERLSKRSTPAQKHPFSIKDTGSHLSAYSKNNELIINIKPNSIHMTLEELALQGKHNLHNSMAAGIAAKLLEIRKDTIKQCLSDFQNVAHRLEYVASIHGIEFINDSKATNVNSTWFALESIDKPIVWIAGGIDKGNDYDLIKDMVRKKVKAIVCLGKDNQKIHEAFKDMIEIIVDTDNVKDAVNAAYNIGEKGEVVLLSPACASFDLFNNYEDRGNQYKNAVKNF